jgi:hypothetical protein
MMADRRRPDAVCPNRASHKDVAVNFSDPDDRTHHWHCSTPIPAGGLCHAEWVTPWREDTFPDADLDRMVIAFGRSVEAAVRAFRDALLAVERVVHELAESDDPTLTEKFYAAVRKAERVERGLESDREDLRVWRIQREMQRSRRDPEGSASVQHFIDTGNYLDLGHEEATVG